MIEVNSLIILLDGAADDKIPGLKYRTPLEALEKPFIDGLTSSGVYGYTDPRKYTHLYLLELLTGAKLEVPRGVIEALYFNLPVNPEYVAYRLSPAILENGWVKWVYELTKETKLKLRKAAKNKMKCLKGLNPKIHFYDECRGVLLVKSSKVLDFPSPPSPSKLNLNDVQSNIFLNFIRSVASEANGLTLMPWGGGVFSVKTGAAKPKVNSLIIVSRSPPVIGVGVFLGLKTIKVPRSVPEGLTKALLHLTSANVLLHVEEVDEVSHMKSPQLKLSMLRNIDDELERKIGKSGEHRVAVVVDHGTSSITGEHLEVNVPFAVSNVSSQLNPEVRFHEGIGKYVPLRNLLEVLLSGS